MSTRKIGFNQSRGLQGKCDQDSPLVAGAGAGTVHPVVLLVRVLVQLLPAVVEGGLDTAHAGEAVHGCLGGAEAGVVTQPV